MTTLVTTVVTRKLIHSIWRRVVLFSISLMCLAVFLLLVSTNLSLTYLPPPSSTPTNTMRVGVCLVGGARRFELTGPSIIDNLLKVHPNADLFLHSPLDRNAFKFSLLKDAPRIASVRILKPRPLPESGPHLRVLSSAGSPNGIQGLLHYFNLIEGCLNMIQFHQRQNNFTYDFIVRTRVDGYWSAPLGSENFVRGKYIVPAGSTFGGLNDRLGIGDFNTSTIALSRLSLIPRLDKAGFRQLNSEMSFKAQLRTHKVPFTAKHIPFCILSDRRYSFPPMPLGVPVAALSTVGPLNGAKCRPCTPACKGSCARSLLSRLNRGWSWTNWKSGTHKLCDAHGAWERGWEQIFDRIAGDRRALARKRVGELRVKECEEDFNVMKRKALNWDTPPVQDICKLGIIKKPTAS